MSVRIEQIAEELGIAPSSVSVALNGKPGVSEETRQRVQAYAEARGWRPNWSARSLSMSRSHAVGVLLRRDPRDLASEPFWMTFLAGMEVALEPRGESLVLKVVDGTRTTEESAYRRWTVERRVDGVILFDLEDGDTRPALLEELALPYVIHGTALEAERANVYIYDTQRDVDLLVRHAQELGHRRLIHVRGPRGYLHEQSRSALLRKATTGAGLSYKSLDGRYSMETAEALLTRELKRTTTSAFVVASNDLMAVGAARATQAEGRRDVAIASWDDSLLCAYGWPSITSLNRHHAEQAARITELLLAQIEGRQDVDRTALPSELTIRMTSVAAS